MANCKGQIQVNKMSIETLKIGNSESDQNCTKLLLCINCFMYKLVKSKNIVNSKRGKT